MKDLTSDDTVSLLQDCRLMRKDELQVSEFFLDMQSLQSYTSTWKKFKVAFVCFCCLIYKILLCSVFVFLVWALHDKSLLAVLVQKHPLSYAILCGSSLSHKAIVMTGSISFGIDFYKSFAIIIKDARFEVLTTVVLEF